MFRKTYLRFSSSEVNLAAKRTESCQSVSNKFGTANSCSPDFKYCTENLELFYRLIDVLMENEGSLGEAMRKRFANAYQVGVQGRPCDIFKCFAK